MHRSFWCYLFDYQVVTREDFPSHSFRAYQKTPLKNLPFRRIFQWGQKHPNPLLPLGYSAKGGCTTPQTPLLGLILLSTQMILHYSSFYLGVYVSLLFRFYRFYFCIGTLD